MNIRRSLTKSRAGHWTLTLTDTDTGHKVHSDRHSTRHGALTEEDALVALLRLQSDMRLAFERLSERGLRPVWVGGEYIVANLPDGGIRTVRSLSDTLAIA